MSITPSVVRGNKGMVGCADFAREHLSEKLDLSRFVVKTEKDFLDVLENETAKFIQEAKEKSNQAFILSWGLARKILNIYLRDIVYCRYFVNYKINAAHLEIPLDSIVFKKIKEFYRENSIRLPTCSVVKKEAPTIKALTKDISDQYQLVAKECAKTKDTYRIHLDALWWGART